MSTIQEPSHNKRTEIMIYQSELVRIAANSAAWRGCETGGDLFGWTNQNGPMVVVLALPPGPQAVHRTAHFRQDAEYLRATAAYLFHRYGLEYLGDWHSHHTLGLEHPSQGDVIHIQRIAVRAALRTLAEIILTHKETAPKKTKRRLLRRMFRTERQADACLPGRRQTRVDRVCAHAFLYPDAANGLAEQCPLRVLPEESPVRASLGDDPVLRTDAKGFAQTTYPLDRIEYASPAESTEAHVNKKKLAAVLWNLLQRLPSEIIEGASIRFRDGMCWVLIPLPSVGQLCMTYEANLPMRAVSVRVLEHGEKTTRDLTNHVLNDNDTASPAHIYLTVVARMTRSLSRNRGHGAEQSKTGEPVPRSLADDAEKHKRRSETEH